MSWRTGGRQPPIIPRPRLVAPAHEILARRPLQQAAMQMDSGDPPIRGPKPTVWYWTECPDLRPVPPGGADYAGMTAGRFTVIGLLPSKKPRWVVRCACGRYEARSPQAIQRHRNSTIWACEPCEYVRHLARQAHFDRTGKWPDDGEHPAVAPPPPKVPQRTRQTSCPPLLPIPASVLQNPTAEILTGRRFGAFTVVGMLDLAKAGLQRGSNSKALWVCRCDCGGFESRTRKALYEGAPSNISCSACAEAAQTEPMARRA